MRRESLWLDEVDAVALAAAPLAEHLLRFTRAGENGPLYFLLLRGWLALAGATTEITLRYASTLASTLAIPLIGAMAARLFGRSTPALLASALCAASPAAVWYAHDAKMYSLYALLALGGHYALIRGYTAHPARTKALLAPWVAYVACLSAGLYCHIFAALQIASATLAGIWLGLHTGRRRRAFGGATMCLLAPYAPLAAWHGKVLLQGADVGYRPVSLLQAGATSLAQLTVHLDRPLDPRWPAAIALVAGWGIVCTRRYGRRGAAGLVVIWTLVPLLCLAALQGRVAVFRDRYLLPMLWPLLLLLTAAACEALAGCHRALRTAARMRGCAVLAATGGAFAFGLAHQPHNPDFRAAAALVQRQARAGDTLAFVAGYGARPFLFYGAAGLPAVQPIQLPYTNYPGLSEADGLQAVARSLRAGGRLWIVRFEPWQWDARDLARRYLASIGASVFLQQEFGGVGVTGYELPS